MQIKDLIYASDIDMVTEQELFRKTTEIKKLLGTERGRKALAGVFTKDDKFLILFNGASTRTKGTLKNTVRGLGGEFDDELWQFSSMAKGEPMSSFVDLYERMRFRCIIMRHDGDDAEKLMQEAVHSRDKKNFSIRFINAGMGNKEHPTQKLIDVFTVQELFPDELLNGPACDNPLRILFSGDVECSRTWLSLLNGGITSYRPEIWMTSPEDILLPEKTRQYLIDTGITFHEMHVPLEKALKLAEPHTLYLSRFQFNLRPEWASKNKEEKDMYEERYAAFAGITRSVISIMPSYTKILHPLPQGKELPAWVEYGPHAMYHEQQANGLPIRMALLIMMFAPNTDLHLLHQDKQVITVHARTENGGTFSMPTEIGNISKLCICQRCENHTGQCTAVESKLSGTWGFISEKDFNSIIGKGQSPCRACRPR